MKISFAATNPCHVWDMARALHGSENLGTYYSGYPAWKLQGSDGLPIKAHSARTLLVYGMRKFLPENLRPKDRRVFRWQDDGFDEKASKSLEHCDFIHGLPGQCRDIFRRARQMGITTVLSHATGPVSDLESVVAPEYERVGLDFSQETQYDETYYAREATEYSLTDYHWAASSIVAERLLAAKVPADRIWTIPYGVDPDIFSYIPPRPDDGEFRILFAGQISLRKGARFLLGALEEINDPSISVDFYGHPMAETEPDIATYTGKSPLNFEGAVSQRKLASAFHNSDLLVLPSLEEGFGLVVIQALACGLPVLVSDAVGAKDAIIPGTNGGFFEAGCSSSLADALREFRSLKLDREEIAQTAPSWADAAAQLLKLSHAVK